jgi:hypothetical protein
MASHDQRNARVDGQSGFNGQHGSDGHRGSNGQRCLNDSRAFKSAQTHHQSQRGSASNGNFNDQLGSVDCNGNVNNSSASDLLCQRNFVGQRASNSQRGSNDGFNGQHCFDGSINCKSVNNSSGQHVSASNGDFNDQQGSANQLEPKSQEKTKEPMDGGRWLIFCHPPEPNEPNFTVVNDVDIEPQPATNERMDKVCRLKKCNVIIRGFPVCNVRFFARVEKST